MTGSWVLPSAFVSFRLSLSVTWATTYYSVSAIESIFAAMDTSNLTSLPEDTLEDNEQRAPQQPRPLSAFASRPDRPPTQWVFVLNSPPCTWSFNFWGLPIAMQCFCRTSSQKYSALDWKGFFDQEEDIRIPDSDDVSLFRIWTVWFCYNFMIL